MLVTKLPYPGVVIGSNRLRRRAAKCLSAIEGVGGAKPVPQHADAVRLKAFFDACSAALVSVTKPKA